MPKAFNSPYVFDFVSPIAFRVPSELPIDSLDKVSILQLFELNSLIYWSLVVWWKGVKEK